jgi:AraC-like DNA-binding protein
MSMIFAPDPGCGYDPSMEIVPPIRENKRQRLVETELFVVDEVRAVHELPPSGLNFRRQLAVPTAGTFEYRTGSKASWLDPTRLLFAEAGEEYADYHPIPGVGHASVIIAPAAELLDELSTLAGPAYADRVRSCPLRLQMLVQLLMRSTDRLAHDEIGSEIVLLALGDSGRVAAEDSRCARGAKSILHEASGERLTLGAIAARLGVTPIYLTQAFKRSEGLPLYRYQTRLRLSRALAALPEQEDITELALDLGFSSHSHFTATFRAALGVTPSDYRNGAIPRNNAAALLAA